MTEGRHPFTQDRIARAARDEAFRDVPAFSDPLHERIMAAVRASHRPPLALHARRASLWPLAAAAALLALVLTSTLVRPPRNESQTRLPSQATMSRTNSGEFALSAPSLPAALVSWGRRESAMEADLGPAHWAGLDHDARLAAHYVLDPLSLPPLRQKPSAR